MITKNDSCDKKTQIQMISLDQLVPEDHILRKIDRYIDFSFIYDLVEEKYSTETGRPSIDPVVLIKIAIIQFMFGIKSMRQTIKEIEVNVAYRWFLGLGFNDKVPHFSTFGKNYKRRFEGTDLFEQIFMEILMQCMKCDVINTDTIFVDATHVKAAANRKKSKKILVAKKSARFYDEQLKEEINADRIAHGKAPLKEKASDDEEKKKDDDDDNTPGSSLGVTPLMPYTRPQTKKGYFRKDEFVYDEYYDCYICPNDKILEYTTTNRDGYREYKSKGYICESCPYLSQCTQSREHIKVVTRHVWHEYIEKCEDIRHTLGMKAVYAMRKETIERDFGTAKEHHAMRYTQLIGKEKMSMKVGLTFACLNMKKLVQILTYRENQRQDIPIYSHISDFISKIFTRMQIQTLYV